MGRKFLSNACFIAILLLSLMLMSRLISSPVNYSDTVPNVSSAQDRPTRNPLVLSVTVNNFIITDCISGELLRQVEKPFAAKDISNYKKASYQKEDPRRRQKSFTNIFKNHEWGRPKDAGYKDVQSSGPGSKLASTKQVVGVLNAVIEKIKKELNKEVISLLDIPCGDMVWMNEYLKSRKDVKYVGMDVVAELIQKHKTRYKQRRNLTFIHRDIVNSEITQPFDLIFSRQMTQHLKAADTMLALQHMSGSGSGFLLITDYISQGAPLTDLNTSKKYRFRPQNLSLDPYRLAPPVCLAQDGASWLALYRLPLLQATSCQNQITKKSGHKFLTCV